MVIFITPPKAQVRMELLSRIGPGTDITVGATGSHIPAGVGMQAPGVSTPKAAAVCAAVIGFNMLMQTPNGAIFTNGAQSAHVASGPVGPKTIFGRTDKTPGAAPKGQLIIAPTLTQNPMLFP